MDVVIECFAVAFRGFLELFGFGMVPTRGRVIALVWIVLLLGLLIVMATNVVIVRTVGIPHGLYIHKTLQERPLTRGQYVCLDFSRPEAQGILRSGVGWMPAAWEWRSVVFRVDAAAGARVTHGPKGVYIDGRPLPLSNAHPRTAGGRALPAPAYPVVLTSESVWLGATGVDAMDSRYFGAVPRAALSCVAEPVWTW